MSDTPRMERAANESLVAVYEQGCQLERELAEVTKQLDELSEALRQKSESALRDAACSLSLSCTPETDELKHRWSTWEGGRVQLSELFSLASRLERERDMWKTRFADVTERLEGKLHCADDCKCSGRREVKMLRSFLLINKIQP